MGRDDELKTLLTVLLDKVEHIDTKVDLIDTKVDRLDERMGSLEVRMESVEARVGALENQVASIAAEQTQIKQVIGTTYQHLVGRVDQLTRQFDLLIQHSRTAAE